MEHKSPNIPITFFWHSYQQRVIFQWGWDPKKKKNCLHTVKKYVFLFLLLMLTYALFPGGSNVCVQISLLLLLLQKKTSCIFFLYSHFIVYTHTHSFVLCRSPNIHLFSEENHEKICRKPGQNRLCPNRFPFAYLYTIYFFSFQIVVRFDNPS